MLSSFTRDEKKILLFLLGLICISSVVSVVDSRSSQVPLFKGVPQEHAVQTTTTSTLEMALGPDGKVDLNRATSDILQSMPGVGPSMAERIVAHRNQIGQFRTIGELDDVPGIGPAILAKLRPHLSVANPSEAYADADLGTQELGRSEEALGGGATPEGYTAPPVMGIAPMGTSRKPAAAVPVIANASAPIININSATAAELESLHRVGPVLAQRIIAYRNQFGAFRSVQDLDNVKGVGPKILHDNYHRLTVR